MLAPTLRRHIRDSPFKDLQKRLLDTLAGNVASDGGVLVFPPNLVDFIDIDNASLGAAYVAVGRLQQFENDVFYILADVSRFSQRSRVHHGKRNIQHAGQSL